MVCLGVRIETLASGITLSTANIPRELAQPFNVDLPKPEARVDVDEESRYPQLGTSPMRPTAHIGRQIIVHPRQRAVANEGDDIGQLERVALVGRIGRAEPYERQLRQPNVLNEPRTEPQSQALRGWAHYLPDERAADRVSSVRYRTDRRRPPCSSILLGAPAAP